MQNNSSKNSLSSVTNEFLKALYIRLAFYLFISLKYIFIKNCEKNILIIIPWKLRKVIGKKRKQVRETIKTS